MSKFIKKTDHITGAFDPYFTISESDVYRIFGEINTYYDEDDEYLSGTYSALGQPFHLVNRRCRGWKIYLPVGKPDLKSVAEAFGRFNAKVTLMENLSLLVNPETLEWRGDEKPEQPKQASPKKIIVLR